VAQAEEVGAMLAPIRIANKPVVCHADGYSNATLMTASRACSRIAISPAGEVEAVGLAAQVVYLHKLLADELHMSVDVLQVGKFKGAEEPLTRDGPSDEARASLEGMLADLRTTWLGTVRGGAPNAEDGPYSPTAAKDKGLVDDIAYWDDALDEARKSSGAVRDVVRFGPGVDEKDEDLGDLLRAFGGGSEPIALVRASGSISMAGGGGLFGGRGGITEHELGKILRKVEKNEDIKALVLRIDSPGGSALASDLLWHQLMKVRAKKPVVVSIGDMAASGGYYLASTGSVIFANKTSIVGSIGVVGGKIGVGGLLDRIGMHSETFTGRRDAAAANRAAYLSPLLSWDDATRGRVLEGMTAIYNLFLARVAEGRSALGRKVTVDQIAPSAEGRIFSGREGKDRGLVDEIGGLAMAIARARSLAKLKEDAGVMVMGARPGLLEALDAPDEDAEQSAVERVAAEALDTIAPEVRPFVESMAGLAEGERAVAALPFACVVR
jgi:protease-4